MSDLFPPRRPASPPPWYAQALAKLRPALAQAWRFTRIVGKRKLILARRRWKKQREESRRRNGGSRPSSALLPWLLITGGIFIVTLMIFFQHSVSHTPSTGIWDAVLYWIKGLWWVWLTLATLVLSLALLRRGNERPKRQRNGKVKKTEPTPRTETVVRVVKEKEVKKSVVRHEFPAPLGWLTAIAILILIGWVAQRELSLTRIQTGTPTATVASSSAATAVEKASTSASAPARGCDQVGTTERVSAPITPTNDKWSRWVYVHDQCTPVPNIPHESKKYRFRCMDTSGKEWEEETGKCTDGGIVALQFQKVTPITVPYETMDYDEFWADLPLEITFKDNAPSA